mgnify:CR=1 FL=1
MAAEDIKKYQFKPGQSGNPKGRPKSTAPEMLAVLLGSRSRARRFYKLTQTDLAAWDELLLSLDMDKLKLLVQTAEAPIYAKGMAMAIVRDMQNGKTATLDRIRERLWGKAVQRVELTGAGGTPLHGKEITMDEARGLIADLEANT